MNLQKKQNIQKVVVDQAGSDRLLLNDLLLGNEGAQIVAHLIPQFHQNLIHLEIKGNNIESEGFQAIFMACMNCPHLKSIMLEWNSLGTSPSGLIALCYLTKHLNFLELLDLKNNRINHQHASYIAELIQINNKSLNVMDLRWNQLGEIGAQIIYSALPYNSAIKFLGLQDNRISIHTLGVIQEMLKNVSRGRLPLRHSISQPTIDLNQNKTNYFPFSDDGYPSMEVQAKTGQLRSKIENQHHQADIINEKIHLEVQKVLQKIRLKGTQIHQAQIKLDTLNHQNVNILNHLRESQRILTLQKERYFGLDTNIHAEKGAIRAEKYNINIKIKTMMERTILRQQKELEDLDMVMSQKMDRLQLFLKDILTAKRNNRQKVAEIREDILKFKINKEAIWDKVTFTATTGNRGSWEDQCQVLEEIIAKAQSSVKAEQKKGNYLAAELSNIISRSLKKEEKYQSDIFELQNKIKQLHNEMGLTNVEVEENQAKIALLQSSTIDKEAGTDLRRKYVKYIQSQNIINLDIEKLKNDQDCTANRLADQTYELRINDLEKALRLQQAQNKMVRNQYEKLVAQIEVASKNCIHAILFEG